MPQRDAILLFTLGVLLAGQSAAAASPEAIGSAVAVARERPRIGLVLGGGGAKGAAHIGVLRVLDEMHIPIDCVVGTSMGALVGATFAAGMEPEKIEKAVLAINWSRTVGTEGLRDRMPINRKLAGLTYTNSLDIGVQNGKLQAPGGLLRTQDIEDVIRGLVSEARLTTDFDQLPMPFRAVATDMLAGEMVVLSEGDLSIAMRASMAVPGAFSPVLIGDKVLSDGGMMRNLAVDVGRELCADVVIAVSLSSPPPKAADLNSAVTLAGRSLDVMIEANQKAQIATLTSADVSIVVPMGDIGSADFGRVPDAVPLGRTAAEAMSEELRRYALPESEYQAWRTAMNRAADKTFQLADVRIEGLDRVNPQYVQAQLENSVPGREVTTAQIIEDTGRIFALGDFEQVEYRVSGPEDSQTLSIHPVEKSWGPDFVRFDAGLAANFDGDLQALLRADYDQTWINPLGGVWHSGIQVGQLSLLQTDLYQPIDVRQRFFIQPVIQLQSEIQDIYDDGDRVAVYNEQEAFGLLDLGVNLNTRAQLRAGLYRGWFQLNRDTGPTVIPDVDRESDTSLQVRAVYDTRNSISYPTRGTFLNARFRHSGSFLGGEQSYDLVEGVIAKSFPWRGDSLAFTLGGGAELDGELPPTQLFQLGGLRTFAGLQTGELRGSSYWYAGSTYLWKLADIQSLFGQALYAGLRLKAGRMGDRIDGVDDGALYGISASLGGRTPIGPFVLSLGVVDNHSWQLQFGLGRPIAEGSILDEMR